MLRLGFEVSERTVSNLMPRRPPNAKPSQTWRTFLNNHAKKCSIDFFTVQTFAFNILFVEVRNRDLEVEVAAGRFREDLFYRLNVMAVNIPPLKERQDDIPLLAQHFLEKYAEKNRKFVKGFAPVAMDMLLKYHWPGNVRELENAIERAVVLMTGDHITENQLPLNIVQSYPDQQALTISRPLKRMAIVLVHWRK